MSFSVFTGGGGYSGWRILSRTADQQKDLVAADPVITRELAYFTKNLSRIETAQDLVSDYRMLSVALKAHGLEDDIGNRAFIMQILNSDLSDKKSLANRFSDERYTDLARSFGFTKPKSEVKSDPLLAKKIGEAFIQSEFEMRVGQEDNSMRIVLYAQRELGKVMNSDKSQDSKWLALLGSPPLAEFIQTSLGFGKNLVNLPIESQLTALKSAAKRAFGVSDISDITKPAIFERAISLYLTRSEMEASNMAANRFSTALALLS